MDVLNKDLWNVLNTIIVQLIKNIIIILNQVVLSTVICEVGECVDGWDKYRDNEFCCEEKCKVSYYAYNPIDALKV